MRVVALSVPKVRVIGRPALPGTLNAGTPFELRADTSNAGTPVAKVEYFDNGRLIGTVTQAPWRLDGLATWVGPHRITARITDDKGVTATSAEVLMTVSSPR